MNFDNDEYKLILEALNAYLDDDESYNVEIRQLIQKIVNQREVTV
tara:strand:+ start:290 stop:424 length:135 start_codon:yes stop_codon:yes gene_type:complete